MLGFVYYGCGDCLLWCILCRRDALEILFVGELGATRMFLRVFGLGWWLYVGVCYTGC